MLNLAPHAVSRAPHPCVPGGRVRDQEVKVSSMGGGGVEDQAQKFESHIPLCINHHLKMPAVTAVKAPLEQLP